MNVAHSTIRNVFVTVCLAALAIPGFARENPTLWIIGDSTVKNSGKGMDGWGERIAAYFDADELNVQNRARGGRSSRSYINEGLWDGVLGEMKEGDYLLIQFGHNDSGREYFDEKGRASLPGYGDDTREGERPDGTEEVVHSFGWYLRKYLADAGEKGVEPIVVSPIPRNQWNGSDVKREDKGYGEWGRKVAGQEDVEFLDLNDIVADYYDDWGPAAVKTFFPGDHTHTNTKGAEFNALCVVEGLRGLDTRLKRYLISESITGRVLEDLMEELDD